MRCRPSLTWLVPALAVAACTSDYGVQPYVEHPSGFGQIQAALSGEFPGSDYQQSPNYSNASRGIGAVKVVVVHTVQGSYAGCISWFKNPAAKVSAHYVVSKTGAVTQMVKEEDIGWHVGSENGYTIGIEHEGFVSDPNYATPQMIEASAKLTCYLLKKWKLPANKTAVKGHVELPKQTHTDPGKFWPWDPYMAKVANCVDGGPPPKPEPAGCCAAKIPVSGSKIIDNVGNDCIQKFGPSSSWWTGNVDKVQGNDGTVTYTYTSTQSTAENWARWRLTFDKPGKYKVEAFVPNNFATAKPTYVVRHAGVNSSYVVDQKPLSNVWADLGTHDFAANCDEYVSVGDNTGQAYSKAVMLGIDMVRVTAVAPPPTCPASCDDKNVCTDDSCQNGKCVHANNTIVCWDQDACTVGEKCSGGACVGGKVTKDCNDGNACTDDGCKASNCTHVDNGAGCDDGNACTSGDKCSAGGCKGGSAKNCDDGNPCTTDACANGACSHAPGGGGCDDGNACTTNDACQGGTCQGKPKVCGGGDGCTGVPTCVDGACVAGQGKGCDDGNPCTDDACVAGACKSTANQHPCDDGNGCTQGEACQGGACTGGGAKVCQDGNPCTQDACAGGACVFAPTGGGCDDGDGCTENDSCKDGACEAGEATDCDDGLDCTADSCADGACVHDGEVAAVVKTCAGLDVQESDPCGGEAKVVATCLVACVDGACQDGGEDAQDPATDAESDAAPGADGATAVGDAAAGSDGPRPDGKLGLAQDVKATGGAAGVAAPPPASSGCTTGSANGAGSAAAMAASLLAWAAVRRRRRA